MLDHIMSQVTNIDTKTKSDIKDMFNFFVPNAFVMPKYRMGMWDGKISLFKNGLLPTSLVMNDYVIDTILANGYDDIEIVDRRSDDSYVQIEKIDKTFLQDYAPSWELRPYQVEAVNKCVDHTNGIFVLGTGAGKTAICTSIVKSFLPFGRVVTIVPSINLVTQTAETYNAFGVESGEFYGENKQDADSIVSTWQSLINYPEMLFGVKCIILDEAHEYNGKEISAFLKQTCGHVAHRYGFTGTLPRDALGQTQLKGLIGPVLMTKDTHELQEEGYLVQSKVNVLITQEDKPEFLGKEHTDYETEFDFLMTDATRVGWVSDKIREIAKSGNTLVLTTNYKCIDTLMGNLPEAHQCCGRINPKKRLDTYRDVDSKTNEIIIATTGVASTGIDMRNLHNVVFFEPGKAFITVIQSIGRGLRLGDDKQELTLWDISASTKYSKRHQSERRKYYKEKKHKAKSQKVIYL